jgi:hypothetical protein
MPTGLWHISSTKLKGLIEFPITSHEWITRAGIIKSLRRNLVKKSHLLCAVIACAIISPQNATANPVVGPNGNAYEYVFLPNTSWSDASIAAASSVYMGVPGHLATSTSQEENDLLLSLIPDVNAAVWLGGFDASGDYFDSNLDDWSWVTGEAFSYSNWADGEPSLPNENYLQIFGGSVNTNVYGVSPGEWNNVIDEYTSGSQPYAIRGYLVEYEISQIPIPPALWLFGSGLLGLVGVARKKAA